MSTHKKNIKRQNTFDEKLYAVMEVLEKKRFNQDVAEEMNIHINSLSNWLRQYRNFGKKGLESNFDKKDVSEHSDEIKRLREIEKKYNEQQEHIEILKKFQAFLKESE